MNDRGVVSFAARIDGGRQDDCEAILTGAGGNQVSTVADTRGQFNFFGFDTSINNRLELAFKAELDENTGFDEGLFSSRGGRVTTHYLASTSQFDGTDSRPSINDIGTIAFEETVDFNSGIFVGRSGHFQTVLAPAPDTSVSEPVLNDAGTSLFDRSFVQNDLFVTEIVRATSAGALTVVVDTRGPFAEFGFRPPALNNSGEVAFLATLDDLTTTGIFVGSNPQTGRVTAVGDTLDGDTITGLRFCEEGLNAGGAAHLPRRLPGPDDAGAADSGVPRDARVVTSAHVVAPS